MTTYLIPIYSNRKSFNNKATVISSKGVIYLQSYNTVVCEIKGRKALVYGTYSSTTSGHIKEFLLQNNFKAENKAQIIKDYLK